MPKWPRPKAGPDVNGGEHLYHWYELPLHVRVSEELPVLRVWVASTRKGTRGLAILAWRWWRATSTFTYRAYVGVDIGVIIACRRCKSAGLYKPQLLRVLHGPLQEDVARAGRGRETMLRIRKRGTNNNTCLPLERNM